MYYYYQPHYYPSAYGYSAYRPVPNPPSVDPRFLYQSVNPSNFSPADPRMLQNTAKPSPYPAVNPNLLYESARESRKLMAEASVVLDKLATSIEFDSQLMAAAQRSDDQEVDRLIRSLGITSDVDATYNPDGLRLEFKSSVADQECCRLLVALRWR